MDGLKQLKGVQEVCRRQKWYDNVAVVVMKYPSQGAGAHGPELKDVLDALEKKYDVLTDKLMEMVPTTFYLKYRFFFPLFFLFWTVN